MLITVWLGAILRSWLAQSLAQRTGGLPLVDIGDLSLPPRWALNTTEAIQSGVIYTIIAGIRDFIEAWRQDFPRLYYFNWGVTCC